MNPVADPDDDPDLGPDDAPDEAAGERRTWSTGLRLRFDEAGPDGLLRTSTLLRYAQDLAWQHSDRRGFTRAWYADRGLVWLARAAVVGVEGEVRVGDDLAGTTSVVGWRRVWARRRTTFHDRAGRLVAWTHVDWVLLDARGAPTRIPPEFDRAFAASTGDGADARTLARVEPGPAPADADAATFAVRPHELDPFGHVNNAVYADWLEERVMAAGGPAAIELTRALPRTMRLEYARPADRGMVVTGQTWADPGGGWWCRCAGPDGKDLLRGRLEPG